MYAAVAHASARSHTERLGAAIPLAAALLVGPLALSGTPRAAGAQAACRPADSESVVVLNVARYALTSTEAGAASLRTRHGLSGVSVSMVALVTDEEVCKKAVAASDLRDQTPNSGRAVYVVKVGTNRYFVYEPALRAGEWAAIRVFNKQFKYVGTLAA
jgi:hypothetical protein